MCATCDKAKTLPVPEALKLVGEAMKKSRRKCMDELVGKLVGVELGTRDKKAEKAWERNRR